MWHGNRNEIVYAKFMQIGGLEMEKNKNGYDKLRSRSLLVQSTNDLKLAV